MSKPKTFTIEFHRFRAAQDSEIKFDDVLKQMSESGDGGSNGSGPIWYEKEDAYELRHIQVGLAFISAEFSKIRLENLPTASSPGGIERDLDLADHEGLLEKNYLTYWPKDNVLAWQRNHFGSTTSRFARYLSDYFGETVSLDKLVTQTALKRLMSNDVRPVRVEVAFAKPTNKELYNPHDFEILKALGSHNGDTFSFTMAIDRPKQSKLKKALNTDVKELLAKLADDENTSTAKVKVLDELDREDLINLMSDRITSEQTVKMKGRYPDGGSMYAALRDAFTEKRDDIYGVIGKPGDRIDT